MLTPPARKQRRTRGMDRIPDDGVPFPPSEPPEVTAPSFSEATIARLLRCWEPLPGVLLAVSGGPDSVALMLLAAAWTERCSGTTSLQVATVDHGLRPRSRDEAETVAEWAKALGLPHTTLVWEGEKPGARIQEKAREKRYELLFAHARKIGAAALATAHHADDQAETILFRMIRGSGITGLAGMAPMTDRGGCLLSRPLLELTKQELVAHCEAANHPYFRDPSNEDPAYARTRIRDLLRRLEPEGLDRQVLLDLGRRAGRADTALAEQARRVRATLASENSKGRIRVEMRALAAEPDEIVMRIIANEIRKINGGHEIRLDRLERLSARFREALRSGTRLSASLGGAIVDLDLHGTLGLRKEPERQRGRPVRSTISRSRSRPEAGARSLGKDEDDAYITESAELSVQDTA
jgi:tRNA(Ile)-lysidine synthase